MYFKGGNIFINYPEKIEINKKENIMKKIRVLSGLVALVILVSATSASSVYAVNSSNNSSRNNLKQDISEKLNYAFLSQVLNSTNCTKETPN